MIHAQLLNSAREDSEFLTQIRREFHQIPEFGLELPKTLQRVQQLVDGLGEIRISENMSALALTIRGGQPGPTVLLRGDMDALAVIEDTGLSYASTNGYMHACGHDLHIAGAIGAARLLAANRDALRGDVVIWFQPGEEGHGGADIMIEEGFLEASGTKPIAAFGIHVFSNYPRGQFGSRVGALMAAAGGMTVTFTGQGGHGSMPWLSRDPISPMTEAITALQTMVAKRHTAFEPLVINVGWIKAGDPHTNNVIPESASFGATIRTFSEAATKAVHANIVELLNGIASAHSLKVEVEFEPATKVLVNDKSSIERVERVIKELFGEGRYWDMPHPIAGGEDFASVLAEVPGAFIFLGACPPEINYETAEVNHSNKARYDDAVLPEAAALLAALAFDTLNSR